MEEEERTMARSTLRTLWWWLRGVRKPEHYRHPCERCGDTGQAHYGWNGCVRYKPCRDTLRGHFDAYTRGLEREWKRETSGRRRWNERVRRLTKKAP